MNYDTIIKIIEEIAPPQLAEEWDNSGVQIYTGSETIEKIMTTLEITDEVVDEAKASGCGMILSHHPLIPAPAFGMIQKIDASEALGARITELIRSGISVYSAHTSFDSAMEGNNTYTARKIGLRNIRRPMNDPESMPGIIGDLPGEMTLIELCDRVEKSLGLWEGYSRAAGNPNGTVKTAAICTGAGFDLIDAAYANGCDVLITGDVKYHQALKAKDMGIAVIDAGHWGTEKSFTVNMAEQLRERCDASVEIIETTINVNPFVL
ncbi:MAG: Nif3-like dinuclear metal center hexameric protein [Eubacteriaceae bacterium]|nr:Nif3-like dinuclear metal center hexameric protein [Eubacteriaceae bacterium]